MQKSKTTRRKPRKKVRRRLHKGRLMLLLTIIAVIVALPLWLFGVFDSDEKTQELVVAETEDVVVEVENVSIPQVSVQEFAEHDAQKIMVSKPESFERHKAILQVKSRESELRLNGYNHAADEYINTIKKICE